MPDDDKKSEETVKASDALPKKTENKKPSKPGKQWKGQKFYMAKSVEKLEEERKLQAQYTKPNAMNLEAYFSIVGVRDYVRKEMMKAYTSVRRATKEDFDAIFKGF